MYYSVVSWYIMEYSVGWWVSTSGAVNNCFQWQDAPSLRMPKVRKLSINSPTKQTADERSHKVFFSFYSVQGCWEFNLKYIKQILLIYFLKKIMNWYGLLSKVAFNDQYKALIVIRLLTLLYPFITSWLYREKAEVITVILVQ